MKKQENAIRNEEKCAELLLYQSSCMAVNTGKLCTDEEKTGDNSGSTEGY